MGEPEESDVSKDEGEGTEPTSLSDARLRRADQRRSEALALSMAGATYEQIGDRLGVSPMEAHRIIERAMSSQPDEAVALRRKMENARLDRLQLSIWDDALKGDVKAIDAYLRISQRRSRLNGMDAPLQIELSGHVRMEMEQALDELQQIVLGEVVDRRDDDDWQPPALER